MAHTKGPWEAWDDDGTGTLPCILSKHVNAGGNFYVAQCNVFEDARLIAAAPELLEACILAAGLLKYQVSEDSVDILLNAIAKAEGKD